MLIGILLWWWVPYCFYYIGGGNFYIFSPPPLADRALQGVCHSLKPGLLCGNNLDRAQGIFDDWRYVDIYVPSIVWVIPMCASSQEDVGGVRVHEWNIGVGLVGLGISLGIEVGMALTSHFLRKRPFLRVILPDPSTLIW